MPVASSVPLRAAAVVLLSGVGNDAGSPADARRVALAAARDGAWALPQEWLGVGETEVQAAARVAPGATRA
ncbi:MAG TPA: hypothetical protein VNU01_07100, partial [Egibacteraceae bacterium]|nr:hypothetical protein [Egibacteraceae bacterium]